MGYFRAKAVNPRGKGAKEAYPVIVDALDRRDWSAAKQRVGALLSVGTPVDRNHLDLFTQQIALAMSENNRPGIVTRIRGAIIGRIRTTRSQ